MRSNNKQKIKTHNKEVCNKVLKNKLQTMNAAKYIYIQKEVNICCYI